MASESSSHRLSFAMAVLLIVAASLAVWAYWSRPWEQAAAVETATVETHSFQQFVRERGQIAPDKVVQIRSNIPSNQAKLVWLRPEGERVDENALVAQFDTKPFNDVLEKAKQALIDAESKVKNAEQAVKLQKEENDARMEAVNRKLEIARIKAEDLRNGSGKLARRKPQSSAGRSESASPSQA